MKKAEVIKAGYKKLKRVKYWEKIHDDTLCKYGTVINETETHYIVIPDDDIRPSLKWLKFKCDLL